MRLAFRQIFGLVNKFLPKTLLYPGILDAERDIAKGTGTVTRGGGGEFHVKGRSTGADFPGQFFRLDFGGGLAGGGTEWYLYIVKGNRYGPLKLITVFRVLINGLHLLFRRDSPSHGEQVFLFQYLLPEDSLIHALRLEELVEFLIRRHPSCLGRQFILHVQNLVLDIPVTYRSPSLLYDVLLRIFLYQCLRADLLAIRRQFQAGLAFDDLDKFIVRDLPAKSLGHGGP
jgi:hypothetical protein